MIVEKQGQPFVALISLKDMEALERLKGGDWWSEFSKLAAQASRNVKGPEPTEEEIVAAVKATREGLYRERYGAT